MNAALQRSYSTMAESHREHDNEDPDSLFIPRDPHYDNEHAARRPRLALPPMGQRYAGDGLDMRRPVMGGSNSGSERPPSAIIDLTDDDNTQETGSQGSQWTAGNGGGGGSGSTAAAGSSRATRPPRFGRNIIDVDEEPDEPDEPPHHAPGGRSTRLHMRAPGQPPRRPQFASMRPSRFAARQPTPPDFDDDLEIVSERNISRPPTASRQHTPAMPVQRSVTPYPGDAGPIDLTDDDEIMITSTRTREGGVNGAPPGTTAGVGTRSEGYGGGMGVGRIADILRNEGRNMGNRLLQRLGMNDLGMHEMEQRGGPLHHRPPVMAVGIGLPGFMDFEAPAFDLGYGGNRPPTPKYSPPPEAADGFTRNPEEDEVVVCPNCGDELGMGPSEEKQQVWAVKGCGHVRTLPLYAIHGLGFRDRVLTRCRSTAGSAPTTASAPSVRRARPARRSCRPRRSRSASSILVGNPRAGAICSRFIWVAKRGQAEGLMEKMTCRGMGGVAGYGLPRQY